MNDVNNVAMQQVQKIEFIESYIKVHGDYQWNDNHGELVRCGKCSHRDSDGYCNLQWKDVDADWFCADGEKAGGTTK